MKLRQSPVVFEPTEHIYTLEGLPLSGITTIINAVLFPNKYGDVPESVLAKAAERGHRVHAEIENYIKTGVIEASEELQLFINLCVEKEIHPLASEYLVSDYELVASCIDMVDTELNLYDFKTTYSLDRNYVSWQLSIYAYLFELQNPELQAGRLFAIHLRNGKATLVEVERKSADLCASLIKAYFDGTPFEYENPELATDELQKAANIAEQKMLAKAYLEDLERQEAELVPVIIQQLKDRKLDATEYQGVSFKISAASTRTTFDSTRFKAENPEVYAKYTKKTEIKESLRTTIK